jgi:hypothetical protein
MAQLEAVPPPRSSCSRTAIKGAGAVVIVSRDVQSPGRGGGRVQHPVCGFAEPLCLPLGVPGLVVGGH